MAMAEVTIIKLQPYIHFRPWQTKHLGQDIVSWLLQRNTNASLCHVTMCAIVKKSV